MSSTPRKTPRGGRGGRGRGRGRSGGRGRGRGNNRSGRGDSSGGNVNNGSGDSLHSFSMPAMRDEEVLIAFMPYLKGDNHEAMSIHEFYQTNNDQQAFLRAARDFLSRDKQIQSGGGHGMNNSVNVTPSRLVQPPNQNRQAASRSPGTTPTPSLTPPRQDPFLQQAMASNGINAPETLPPIIQTNAKPNEIQQFGLSSPEMANLERKMASLLSDDDDPVVNMPLPFHNTTVSAIGSGFATSSMRPLDGSIYPPHVSAPSSQGNHRPQQQQEQLPYPFQQSQPSQPPAVTPPRGVGMPNMASPPPFSSLFPSNNSNDNSQSTQSPFYHRQKEQQYSPQQQPIDQQKPIAANWAPSLPPPGISNAIRTPEPAKESRLPMQRPATVSSPVPPVTTSTNAQEPTTDVKAAPAKREYQPKRLWTRLEEQPGKLSANNVPAVVGTVLDLRPRQELRAQWILPLSYLREKSSGKNDVKTLRDSLKNLTVGLFRRGCTENGTQASIVSKEILSPQSRSDYPFQVVNGTAVGTVPFYSPRTPGHVVFRLYWQDEPLHTLATGPTLNVRVTEEDFESSIRFILSNFKAKKVNPTSLSSLNSFALVLEQFQLTSSNAHQHIQQQLEGAGRAVWGCICEARKVLDACAAEYTKTTSKLEKLEEAVEELKEKIEAEKGENMDTEDDEQTEEEHLSENAFALKEKTKALMSGRASCERKWRDSQLAFASILKAVVTNPAISMLLRRELITKLRLEYELWCPLCEEFAVPGDSDAKMWYAPLSSLPHSITPDHFRFCTEARSKMQQRILGFDPNTMRLENILYPNRGRNRQMNPAAVNVFNQLSGAMGQLYHDVYTTADKIHQRREMIRQKTEEFVNMCDCFPPGTKVAVFGSSANGFGSPKSDLDMCLQIPEGEMASDEEDPSGSKAMAKLAQILEENGMKEVDPGRLTARIPVIKFNCPIRMEDGSEAEEAFMECDLSMHNPLAVLNTSLLRAYAEINPVPRVLAGVIKRWAKSRDINNPARHTLSSYGYIVMLLHFLTFHQRSGNGLVSPVTQNEGKSPRSQVMPLLPNLQWMDDKWPGFPPGTPYREQSAIPKNNLKHPLEDRAVVNTYFYRPSEAMLSNLQRLFPGQDLSLGILLASFFRYYAYEFDYKRHVVSLHSTVAHGLVEREVKAELDGWRNYSAALTIEDPFETFYDVAHVLRGGYYHRIRREFAVAYTKIGDIASGKSTSTWANKTVDLSKMNGMELIEWICEPVATEREEAST